MRPEIRNSHEIGGAPKILIIDDEYFSVRLLTAILEKEGFEIFEAFDGPAGREIARRELPDLIMLDFSMPREDGTETCRLLKQDPRTVEIPVIFVSACNENQTKLSGLSNGGVDFIAKPFDRREVLARIRIHLKLSRANRMLIEQQAGTLRLVHNAQEALLVKSGEVPDAGFSVIHQPLMEAGGDFYDVVRLADGIFGYFVADVSGHDLGTAFLTSGLKALVRQNTSTLHTPEETLRTMNRVLHSMFQEGQYATACYAILNRRMASLTVVSAGHPPVIHAKASGAVALIETQGDVLGAYEGALFNQVQVPVTAGDRLIFYTDGIIEHNQRGAVSRAEGIGDLARLADSTRSLSREEATGAIARGLAPKDGKPTDDVLVLIVEV